MAEPAILLTEDEVATRLKCSTKTVQRRRIPHVKMGRLRRYRPEDVEAYLCTCVVKRPDEQPSNPSNEEKSAKPTGRRGGWSRIGKQTVLLPHDESKEALALIAKLRGRGRKNAQNGTSSMRRDLETLDG
jgi:excisionase family DNA binding protein